MHKDECLLCKAELNPAAFSDLRKLQDALFGLHTCDQAEERNNTIIADAAYDAHG